MKNKALHRRQPLRVIDTDGIEMEGMVSMQHKYHTICKPKGIHCPPFLLALLIDLLYFNDYEKTRVAHYIEMLSNTIPLTLDSSAVVKHFKGEKQKFLNFFDFPS
ncbi:hypothetical protein TNCV_2356081 [Trichonephila clavipes]|nr:hypothetical protein TNCV_2356081 [Trichonephila clavipes]